MKHITTVALALFLFAVPAFAGVPAQTELGLSGSLVKTSEGPDPWSFNLDLLFAVGAGHVVLGPSVVIGDDNDTNRLGASLEWNLTGQRAAVTPYIGVQALGLVKSPDDGDRHQLVGRAGLKIKAGKGAAIKLGVADVLDGVYKDSTDLVVEAGIIARF